MSLLAAITVGVLFAAGVFLMLRRSVLRVVLGLTLVSHACNLLIFAAGGLTRGVAPIAAPDKNAPPVVHADPLPQALVLTAIVISFGVLCFLIVLASRATQRGHGAGRAGGGSDDLDTHTEDRP